MLLFTKASIDQIDVIKGCLDRFSKASGWKVNLTKSHMFVSNNIDDNFAGHLAQVTGITLTKDLGRYLGVPSLHGKVTESTFSAVLDRINSRLDEWKAKQLSLVERQVLAQSILSTIPYYVMQQHGFPSDCVTVLIKGLGASFGEGTRKEEVVTW